MKGVVTISLFDVHVFESYKQVEKRIQNLAYDRKALAVVAALSVVKLARRISLSMKAAVEEIANYNETRPPFSRFTVDSHYVVGITLKISVHVSAAG